MLPLPAGEPARRLHPRGKKGTELGHILPYNCSANHRMVINKTCLSVLPRRASKGAAWSVPNDERANKLGAPPVGMSRTTERIPLSEEDVAYLVGRSGATKYRLERFSGAQLSVDRDAAEIEGTEQQRALAKLSISITLQQRDHGTVTVNFDDLEQRSDVSTFDVPKETVGFLLGAKGSTLRQLETDHKVFMFFNNERIREGKSGPCKRLYVIGGEEERRNALDEAEDVVRYKLTGTSMRPRSGRGGGAPSWHDAPPPPRHDDRFDDRYDRGPPPPRFDDRDRDYNDRRGPPPPRYDDRYRECAPLRRAARQLAAAHAPTARALLITEYSNLLVPTVPWSCPQ
jgi:hypothetical protein